MFEDDDDTASFNSCGDEGDKTKRSLSTELQLGCDSRNSQSVYYSGSDDSDGMVFSQQSSMTKPSINFHGVKEGNSYGYDFDDVVFEFAGQPVRLYTDPEGDAVCFEHFTKFPDGRCTPSGYGLLDFKLFQNLQNQNFIAMRPIQLAAFMAVLFQAPDHTASPKDFLGISETGSGKTMAFLVPIIQKCLQKAATTGRNLKPTALIFVYSNLLAVNIFQRAQDLTSGTNVKVELICGGKSFIKNTHFDVGICTIGRYKAHSEQHQSRSVKIDVSDLEFLVIDEADKMVAEPDNCGVFKAIQKESKCSTLLFSATFISGLSTFYDAKNAYEFCYGSKRLNAVASSVTQHFWPVNSKSFSMIFGSASGKAQDHEKEKLKSRHPFDAICLYLKYEKEHSKKRKKYIIFVKRTITADIIASRLKLYEFDVITIHGKQEKAKREQYLKEFEDGKVNILVGTNLLTRGIDVSADIVFNYDLPTDYLDYVHRCGRVGRSKNKGQAITLIDFKNIDDYNPLTLQQIALKIEDVPDFMKDYVANVRETVAFAKQQREQLAAQYADDC